MQNKDFMVSDWNWATKKKKKIHREMMSLRELEHSGKQSASLKRLHGCSMAVQELHEKLSSLSCN